MPHCCFKKSCEHEALYVCLCLCYETYCCEFHLGAHLRLRYRTHNFDSIFVEPDKWTKAAILEFLVKEKLKKEKLKEIAISSFAQKSYKLIQEILNNVDSDLKNLNNLIEKISQISEKDEKWVQNLSIIALNTYPETAKEILPEPYWRVMLFLISIKLRNKKWSILNKVNNDRETEQDFRRTCALYENLASDSFLSQVYQEYINAYHKLTSIY